MLKNNNIVLVYMDNNINNEIKDDKKRIQSRERNRRFYRQRTGKPADTEVREYNRLSNMTEEERREYLKQQKKENNRRLYERNKQKIKTNINALENA
jgi:hypothetical protein